MTERISDQRNRWRTGPMAISDNPRPQAGEQQLIKQSAPGFEQGKIDIASENGRGSQDWFKKTAADPVALARTLRQLSGPLAYWQGRCHEALRDAEYWSDLEDEEEEKVSFDVEQFRCLITDLMMMKRMLENLTQALDPAAPSDQSIERHPEPAENQALHLS